MESFVHNGCQLEYSVSGSGLPFVFLHGMGGSVQQIYKAYDVPDGVSLITMNQQGHGGSGAVWDTFGFPSLAEDVLALLDLLALPKVVLGGISMGAAVSLAAALRAPQRVQALVLVRNAWTEQPMSIPVRQAYADLGRCLEKGGVTAFQKTKGWDIVNHAGQYTRNAFLSPFEEEASVRNWQKYLLLPPTAPIESRGQLADLDMPALVLACHNDLCHPYERGVQIASALPRCRFVSFPDKDTDPVGHRSRMKEEIDRFLREVGKTE